MTQYLEKFAGYLRRKSAEMALHAGNDGCHIGGSFSCLEIFAVLYGEVLKFDVENPTWENRDRFIPSKTHCILSNFSALARVGFLNESELFSFHEDGGLLAGHPWNVEIGLEYSGGSLGMGLSVGIGMALSARMKGLSYKTYVLLGDGECNEGSVWEAMMSAAHYRLDNLIAIIDYNNMQFDGIGDDIMSLKQLKAKTDAFGWKTVEVPGHDLEAISLAFKTAHNNQPLMIIAHTVKAHGVPELENLAESHHAVMKEDTYQTIINSIDSRL